MALDGITTAALAKELQDKLAGGRISKIAQPETDELILTIKGSDRQYRLLISANASLPLMYLTENNKMSPEKAPGFCMLLRKHIAGGRIISVSQPDLERIIRIEIEHLNELGDVCRKYLITELMGKHSNIIFTDQDDRIIDSIKHIPLGISSVREVLPGRNYFIPNTMSKHSPFSVSGSELTALLRPLHKEICQALNMTLTGISPAAAASLCQTSGIDPNTTASSLTEAQYNLLHQNLCTMMSHVREGVFAPRIYYRGEELLDFAPLPMSVFEEAQVHPDDSISHTMETYYAEKSTRTRIHQKSADLRHIVQTALERNVKKYDLQQKQMKDTEKRDKYRVYGELIQAYGYGLEPDASVLSAPNYYDDNRILNIPLDPTLSPQENSVKYFQRYNKLKRTYEALTLQLDETRHEIEYLRSVVNALEIALYEEDLTAVKEELQETGYIRKTRGKKEKKARITSKPYHYLSSDGFHIYVGKNNLQNDELTFRFASGNDWWFHAKGIPGSHVIVKTEGQELTDRTYEEAGALAAFYSSAPKDSKVEIDYTQKKQLKKPVNAKPGFVIYHTNYSLVAAPSLKGLTLIP